MLLRAINATRGTLLAEESTRVTSFLGRFLGLMGRSALRVGRALEIRPCDSIHTFFMRFPIDVLFLDEQGGVLRVVRSLVPWRAVLPVRGAHSVLELPAGVASASGTQEGDSIRFESVGREAKQAAVGSSDL